MKAILTLFLSLCLFSNLYSQVVSKDSIPITIYTAIFEEELDWIEYDEWIDLRITEFNTNEVYYDTSAVVSLVSGFLDTVYLDSGLYKCEILDMGANVYTPLITLNNGDVAEWGYPDYEYFLFSLPQVIDPCADYSYNDTTDVVSCDSFYWNNVNYTESGFYTVYLLNSDGCDSILNLNLSLNYSSESSQIINSCASSYTWNNVNYTESGEYTFLTLNSNNCDSVAKLILTLNPIPEKTTITQYWSTTLKSDYAYSYQWYLNGNKLVGETSQYLNFDSGGNYMVETTDSNGCVQQSEPFTIGESENDNSLADRSLKVYPNPSSGVFEILLPNEMHEKDYTLDLLHMNGKLIYSVKNNANAHSIAIDISDLPDAKYFILLRNNKETIVKTIIKN